MRPITYPACNCFKPQPGLSHVASPPTTSDASHPLAKVLFIFPSRYLCSFGFEPVLQLQKACTFHFAIHFQGARLGQNGSCTRAFASKRELHPRRHFFRKTLEQCLIEAIAQYSLKVTLQFPDREYPLSFATTGGFPFGFSSSAY